MKSKPKTKTGRSWTVWPNDLPVYDHIVIVVEENKDWADIIGNTDAPYINQLASEGALFTQSFGCEHHSQGNYFWLFSGSNQGVGFMDEVPSEGTVPGYPFTTSNLGQQLIDHKYSFKGYSESLPEIGSTVDHTVYGDDPDHDSNNPRILYARKHVPWISFANVPNGNTVDTSSNLRFEDFPTHDYRELPTVSFVIPDLEHDMHNLHEKPSPTCNKGSVCVGDTWLRNNLDDYYQWAKNNNSLLIVTFDEDNGMGYAGLTDPAYPLPPGTDCKQVKASFEVEHPGAGVKADPRIEATPCGMRNGIVTIFAGAYVKPGQYDDPITHVNVLRTIEAMYGLPKSGAQQENALNAGISDDYVIDNVFYRKHIQPPPQA